MEELLELNKDVTESVPEPGMARSILLNKGGAGIKKLQKDVNEKTKESDGAVFRYRQELLKWKIRPFSSRQDNRRTGSCAN